MERYTKRMTDCWIKTKSGKDYTNKTQDYDAMLKLADYEDYDEKGLLVRLPFKLGDTYYRLLIGKIYANEFTCLSTIITFMENHDFGRTVFSSAEEAMAALNLERQKDGSVEKLLQSALKLPCKVGTTIYVLSDKEDGIYQRIKNDVVEGYYLDDKDELYLIPTYLWHKQPISEIGKTIFFSEEEAKKALLSQHKKIGEMKDHFILIEETRTVLVKIKTENVEEAIQEVEAAYERDAICLNNPDYIADGTIYHDETEIWEECLQEGIDFNYIEIKKNKEGILDKLPNSFPRYSAEQTSDAFAEPFIIRDNWIDEGNPAEYYSVSGVFQTFDSEEEAQAYADQLNQTEVSFSEKQETQSEPSFSERQEALKKLLQMC